MKNLKGYTVSGDGNNKAVGADADILVRDALEKYGDLNAEGLKAALAAEVKRQKLAGTYSPETVAGHLDILRAYVGEEKIAELAEILGL